MPPTSAMAYLPIGGSTPTIDQTLGTMVSSNKDEQTMAITHADLHMRRRSREFGGWVGTAVVFFVLLSGLLSLVLCLLAASTRSKSNGEQMVITATGDKSSPCMAMQREDWPIVFYEEIGSAISVAFGLLAIHLHLWDATENKHLRRGPIELTWALTDAKSVVYKKQAALLFLAAWICFVVGEGMLLSEAVSGVKQMKNSSLELCLSTPYWLLVASGVVELLATFLATGFYVLIVKMDRERDREMGIARELMEVRREIAALEIIYPPFNQDIAFLAANHTSHGCSVGPELL